MTLSPTARILADLVKKLQSLVRQGASIKEITSKPDIRFPFESAVRFFEYKDRTISYLRVFVIKNTKTFFGATFTKGMSIEGIPENAIIFEQSYFREIHQTENDF